MENPYQPPETGEAVEKTPPAIRRWGPRRMTILLSMATILAGYLLEELVGKNREDLEAFQERAPAFLREWLQFASDYPGLSFPCVLFLCAVAIALLNVDKCTAALERVALGLVLLGLVIVLGWGAVWALAVIG